jgi:hypothetical protein
VWHSGSLEGVYRMTEIRQSRVFAEIMWYSLLVLNETLILNCDNPVLKYPIVVMIKQTVNKVAVVVM